MISGIRYAVRALVRTPAYSAAIIAVLMLGIGANAAMFSALDQVVLRPLPFAEPDRLAALWEDFSVFGTPKQRVSPATFFDWQRRTHAFSALAAYRSSGFTLTGDREPESLTGIAATANLIPTLGVSPQIGRTFTAAEEQPGVRLIVISHRLWQRRFRGDADILGRTVRLNDEAYTVIGVMPPWFLFPDGRCDYWVPLGLAPELAGRRNSHFLFVVGRLRSDRTWNETRADMGAIAAQLAAEHPDTNARIGISVTTLKDEMLQGADTSLLVLFGAAACVLLIACANAANLALVRTSERQSDIAIRMALGASVARVAAATLIESALLASAGTVAGLLLARWCMSGLEWLVPGGVAGSMHLHIDVRAVAFSALAAGAATIAFGLFPVLPSTADWPLPSISSANRRITPSTTGRLRQLLVVVEVALALVLLAATGLLLETLFKLRTVDLGFRSERVLTASIEAPYPKYADPAVRRRFFENLLVAIGDLPGIESVGLTSDLPYTSRGNTMSIRIEHRDQQTGVGSDALFRLVSPGYLRTIGARLDAGRLLTNADTNESTPVVVVNESFLRQYFDGTDPLGHRIDSGTGTNGPRWMTIVGVVADVRERGADQQNRAAVYVPFTQTDIGFFQPSEVAVRTVVQPTSLTNDLKRAVWSIDPEQPVSQVRTMDDILDADVAGRRQVLTLVLAFSALALTLAGVGLYSVLSCVVAQSRHEIGIRIAIGATPRAVVNSILMRAAGLAAAGVVTGLLAAVAVTRVLGFLLYDVSPLDPRVLGAVAALVAAIAMAASYLPAHRAATTDPLAVLRGD